MITLRKILVPTDFSPGSAAALELATTIAKQFNAEIVLMHVLQSVPVYVSVPSLVPLPTEWVAAVHQQAESELATAARHVSGVKITTELRDGGSTHVTLTAAAVECKADLIVIGTHGRTGLQHVMLGSVAERVVRHATVPVLTVRAPKNA